MEHHKQLRFLLSWLLEPIVQLIIGYTPQSLLQCMFDDRKEDYVWNLDESFQELLAVFMYSCQSQLCVHLASDGVVLLTHTRLEVKARDKLHLQDACERCNLTMVTELTDIFYEVGCPQCGYHNHILDACEKQDSQHLRLAYGAQNTSAQMYCVACDHPFLAKDSKQTHFITIETGKITLRKKIEKRACVKT